MDRKKKQNQILTCHKDSNYGNPSWKGCLQGTIIDQHGYVRAALQVKKAQPWRFFRTLMGVRESGGGGSASLHLQEPKQIHQAKGKQVTTSCPRALPLNM